MARRHPIITLVLITGAIVGLFLFAKTFQASSTLSHINQIEPESMYDSLYPNKSRKDFTHFGKSNKHKSKESSSVEAEKDNAEEIKYLEEEARKAKEGPGKDSIKLESIAAGKPIMAKMPNQTVRAEVGRAGWKMLHTILSQYPEKPTADERQTLSTYLRLFSRVYPCRECAEHFQELLKSNPPQLASRQNAVMWGCQAHNVVNKRLGKKEHDCTYIFDEYDCGCGSEEEDGTTKDGDIKSKKKGPSVDDKPKSNMVPLQRGG